MSELPDFLLKYFFEKMGARSFYSLRQLVSSGIFGSMTSVRRLLKAGRLGFVKVSQRRVVIPRQDLLIFLQKNLNSQNQEAIYDFKKDGGQK